MTFEFSGDNQWARWSAGVECSDCANVAIGVAVDISQSGNSIEISPVCEIHATDRNVIMFEEEDN